MYLSGIGVLVLHCSFQAISFPSVAHAIRIENKLISSCSRHVLFSWSLSFIGDFRPWFTAFLSTHAQDSIHDDFSIHMYDLSSSLALSVPWHFISFLFKIDNTLYLCDPMHCSPPGSSVHGISQARILELIAISSSRGSSWPRDQTPISSVSYIGGWILYHWATWEVLTLYFLIFFFHSTSAISSHDHAVHSHGHTFNLVMIYRSLPSSRPLWSHSWLSLVLPCQQCFGPTGTLNSWTSSLLLSHHCCIFWSMVQHYFADTFLFIYLFEV